VFSTCSGAVIGWIQSSSAGSENRTSSSTSSISSSWRKPCPRRKLDQLPDQVLRRRGYRRTPLHSSHHRAGRVHVGAIVSPDASALRNCRRPPPAAWSSSVFRVRPPSSRSMASEMAFTAICGSPWRNRCPARAPFEVRKTRSFKRPIRSRVSSRLRVVWVRYRTRVESGSSSRSTSSPGFHQVAAVRHFHPGADHLIVVPCAR